MTYAEFKRLDVYKTAVVVEIFDEIWMEIFKIIKWRF